MKPQTFALITAGVVGGTGLMGLAQLAFTGHKATTRGLNATEQGRIGGVVPTNTLFNWVRVGIGAAGVFAAQNEKSAVIYNRAVAGSYVAMGIMGMIPKTETMFGLMPLYGANIVLHTGIAAAEIASDEGLLDIAKGLLPFQSASAKAERSLRS